MGSRACFGSVAIDVRDLDVRRGDRRVLPGVSVQIRSGAVTGLLGRSGSGKTTLMRAIVGVQGVHGGEIIVLGRPAGDPALRRRVAYVTQAPSVYADLTVRENLRYEKVADDDIDARFWLDVTVILATIALSLILAAATLRRRTP